MRRLWGRPSSVCTMRALFALDELGLGFEFILASATMGPNGSTFKGNAPFGIVDTPAYRAMNPNGTVPTLDDDGFIVWESNTLVRYLAMKYGPDALYGSDVETFASASSWMDWDSAHMMAPQHVLVMHGARLPEADRDPAALDVACQRIDELFALLDRQLANTRFLAGDRFTMGDIPAAIHKRRWDVFARDGRRFANVERWYAEVAARPAFRKWVEPASHHDAG